MYQSKQNQAVYCARRGAGEPGFTVVSRATQRQNERQWSPETGTPAGATIPNHLPSNELADPALNTAATKLKNPRAPRPPVANRRRPPRQNSGTPRRRSCQDLRPRLPTCIGEKTWVNPDLPFLAAS